MLFPILTLGAEESETRRMTHAGLDMGNVWAMCGRWADMGDGSGWVGFARPRVHMNARWTLGLILSLPECPVLSQKIGALFLSRIIQQRQAARRQANLI